MKNTHYPYILFAMAVVCVAGCDEKSSTRRKFVPGTITEGILYSVEYKRENGKTGGFTRSNIAGAVPGGSGNGSVDAYGQLTNKYLFITRPKRKNFGPRVIPVRRLVDIQFGDGGIKDVDKQTPPPAG